MKALLKRIPGIALLSHWRWFLCYIFIPVILSHFRYRSALRRLRRERKVRKLKVGFVICMSSKWKGQSLYDKLSASTDFEPCIVLTICDAAAEYSLDDCNALLDETGGFFARRGMKCVEAFSRKTGKCLDLSCMGFDVVFYHQPWSVDKLQMPHHVARTALTFYIPYYVADYGDCHFDCDPPFNRTVYGYLTTNELWARCYEEYMHRRIHECRYLPLGHTGLDFSLSLDSVEHKDKYVIYAPHWAFSCDTMSNTENYSTFLWTGRFMLEYAKRHAEYSWVFKPHPTLKHYLHKTGVWSDVEIDAYYSEWAKIAIVCLDGDYYRYFLDSKAMITDCGSFLMEYPSTGKPLIHLISPDCKVKPIVASAKLFQTFYQVRTIDELKRMLKLIIEEGQDPKREFRLECAREMGLVGNDAATKIVAYMRKLFN